MPKNIYDLCKSEEANYKLPIPISEGWEWSMYDHITKTVLYKNSQFSTGKIGDKPFKNIIRPILNLQYRTEGFDVKDITLFVDDAEEYYKSFLIAKYHDRWARENGIDTFIDELVESYVDFGGALVKNVNSERPEVVPLQSIAFCDQTDILSGPIGIKHNYSPDQLLEFESKGWGKFGTTLDELIVLAENAKQGATTTQGTKAKTPGKYIEVYEVHGVFPTSWLTGNPKDEGKEPSKYSRQVHIISYYQTDQSGRQGVTLFKGKVKDDLFKFIARDKIFGRALGLGGAEELFEPQVWTNYNMIIMQAMLNTASKMLFQTSDPTYAVRNKTADMENGEILIHAENQPLTPVNTQPVNISVFENAVKEWETHAQQMGSASDALLGEAPSAGTPFKLQDLITQQGSGIHEYRQGKLATFVDEIYRDWEIPYINTKITQGQEFLADLELDELQQVADSLVSCVANNHIKELILSGQIPDPQTVDELKQRTRDDFMQGGNKRFIKIFKDEMKDVPVDVRTNIKGKQKDLAGVTDKVTNIMRFAFSTFNPQTGSFAVFDDPRMAKLMNTALESSGLSPIDYYAKAPEQPQLQQQPQQPQQQPLPVAA